MLAKHKNHDFTIIQRIIDFLDLVGPNVSLSEVASGTEIAPNLLIDALTKWGGASLDDFPKYLSQGFSHNIPLTMDIPHSVVINEAIELAKSFGAETSFQYINAVLDSYCQKIKNS